MRVTSNRSTGATSVSGVSRTESASDKRAPEPVAPAAPNRSVADVASFLGIPENELTPKVREGIARLIDEVDRLRRDLQTRDQRIQHLEQLADEDPLAPILNRRAFVRDLGRMVAYAERYGTVSSVLYFDLNGLKAINDRHGHAAGDAALSHVAQVLLDNTRGSDIVGRLGGDEFGVILVQADESAAARKGQELAETIARTTFDWQGTPLTVSTAVGSFAFDGREAAHEVLDRADKAMYDQKRRG
jgi:diguanylate cyclase (GGDEF)-like protein